MKSANFLQNPMWPRQDQALSGDAETWAGLFTTTAQRINSTPQNIENDFWVCSTFNGLPGKILRFGFTAGFCLSAGGCSLVPPTVGHHQPPSSDRVQTRVSYSGSPMNGF
jgi:hypothetical protein